MTGGAASAVAVAALRIRVAVREVAIVAREVVGDQTYESLARKDETITTAAMVTYTYDQIDQARAELKGASK